MHKARVTLTMYVSDTYTCGECRFCAKTKGSATCLLSNEILTVGQVGPEKARWCLANVDPDIEDTPAPSADIIVKDTMKKYTKYVGAYIQQGYEYGLADKLAKDALKKEGISI